LKDRGISYKISLQYIVKEYHMGVYTGFSGSGQGPVLSSVSVREQFVPKITPTESVGAQPAWIN
jgi:hypothetical protein